MYCMLQFGHSTYRRVFDTADSPSWNVIEPFSCQISKSASEFERPWLVRLVISVTLLSEIDGCWTPTILNLGFFPQAVLSKFDCPPFTENKTGLVTPVEFTKPS